MARRVLPLLAVVTASLVLASCPLVEFTIEVSAGPESGPAPLAVDFIVTKFIDRKIDIVSWDFGDGSPPVSGPYLEYRSITHEFQDPGEYSVACLAVDDGVFQDFSAYETVLITVTNPETSGLTVTIDGTPLSGCPAGTLDVSFTSTVTGGTPPYTYDWDFGDGSGGSTEANPSHSYEDGPFDVGLTVIDSLENSATSNTLMVEYCPD